MLHIVAIATDLSINFLNAPINLAELAHAL